MRHELSPQRTLIVRGPASITLLTGQATILGAPFPQNHTMTIPRQKQLPIETETHGELQIVLNQSAETLEIQGSAIPTSWKNAADALDAMGAGKAVVLGQTDVGKSTLCVYLVNRLLQNGHHVCVIDADIGQTDLGPPTTIARAIPTAPITSLMDLAPETCLFIGHTSPSYVEGKLIQGIQGLSTEEPERLTIINTDGWVAEPDAILYKMNLIDKVGPDIVLALEFEHELQSILAGARTRSLKLSRAKHAMERSRGDRRTIRADRYKRFLEGAQTREVSLGSVQVLKPRYFPPVQKAYADELRNLIVGILNHQDHLVQIGILMNITNASLGIYSRPDKEIHKVEIGHVRLSASGSEIGFL
jgi:polynucleotide 5'-hydroxyl-kinase GRC3/NOL9